MSAAELYCMRDIYSVYYIVKLTDVLFIVTSA